MLENNCEYAIIESSSHGLSKKTNRCGDIHYDVGIVTNVTHEHLEFHGTREQYAFDKANLFRSLDLFSHEKTVLGLKSSVPTFGVINADDSVAFSFLEDTKQACFFFSEKSSVPLKEQNIDSKAFFYASNIISSEKQLSFTLTNENLTKQSVEVETNLIGTFNVHNILASIITVSKIMGNP